MPTEIEQLKMRLAQIQATGRLLISAVAATGFDLRAPDFMGRLHSDISRLESQSTQGANEIAELRDRLTRYEATIPKGSEVVAPEHHIRPRLGTTEGDRPPLREDVNEPEVKDLIDRLNDRIFGSLPGHGLRIGTGEAASGDTVETLRKSVAETDKQLKYLKEWVELTERLVKQLEEKNRLYDRLDAAEKKLKSLRQPVPDAPEGDYKPKHPLDDPYSDSLRRPKGTSPLGDPLPGEEPSEPSRVLRSRGQATDPVPGDDKIEGGQRKGIVTTSDAVTDPPRHGTANQPRSGLLSRIFNLFR